MNQNLKITLAAFLTIAALFGLAFLLEWGGLDWEKWSSFVIWTAFVFGSIGYLYERDLRKRRCLLVLVAALALHVIVLIGYLNSVSKFPHVFFLFFSPLEGAGVGVLLLALGGARPHRTGRLNRHSEDRWPPKSR